MVRHILFAACFGVALSPLWYGSAVATAQAGNAIGFGLLAALTATASPALPAHLRRSLVLPGLLWCAALVWAVVQSLPMAPTGLAHPLWELARDHLDAGGIAAIGLDPVASLRTALRLAMLALVFWMGVKLGVSADDGRKALWGLLAAGAAYATYGLWESASGRNHILFTPKDRFALDMYGAIVSGTFINRNHFAAYAAMGLAIATALLLRATHRLPTGHVTTRKRIASALAGAVIQVAPVLVFAAPIALALVLTQSRAGLLVGVAGAGMVVLLHALGRRSARPALAAGILVALGAAAALLSVGEALYARSVATNDPTGGRLDIYVMTLKALADRPLLGFGAGAFEAFFPLYREAKAGIGGVWNAAHNSWIEVLATFGLPAGLALLLAPSLIAARAMRGVVERRRDRAAPAAAAGAATAMAIHSAVDFPLQIEANALTLAFLLGLGFAQAFPSGRRSHALSRNVAAGMATAHP